MTASQPDDYGYRWTSQSEALRDDIMSRAFGTSSGPEPESAPEPENQAVDPAEPTEQVASIAAPVAPTSPTTVAAPVEPAEPVASMETTGNGAGTDAAPGAPIKPGAPVSTMGNGAAAPAAGNSHPETSFGRLDDWARPDGPPSPVSLFDGGSLAAAVVRAANGSPTVPAGHEPVVASSSGTEDEPTNPAAAAGEHLPTPAASSAGEPSDDQSEAADEGVDRTPVSVESAVPADDRATGAGRDDPDDVSRQDVTDADEAPGSTGADFDVDQLGAEPELIRALERAEAAAAGEPLPGEPSDHFRQAARKAIEAIVLVSEEPMPPHLLAQLLEVSPVVVDALCRELADSYEAEGRGFQLVRVAGGWRYQSHPEQAPYVERLVLEGQTAKLSAAALETLAIVAYKQPISRAQVASIRGVSVDGVMRTLQQRGFIVEIGKDPGPGQAIMFGTSRSFLEKLGIDTLDELPPLGDFVPDATVVEQLERGLRPDREPLRPEDVMNAPSIDVDDDAEADDADLDDDLDAEDE